MRCEEVKEECVFLSVQHVDLWQVQHKNISQPKDEAVWI